MPGPAYPYSTVIGIEHVLLKLPAYIKQVHTESPGSMARSLISYCMDFLEQLGDHDEDEYLPEELRPLLLDIAARTQAMIHAIDVYHAS